MKAVIMAGGEGRRLRPITEKMPKPLVPVNGIPAITRILRLLRENGITETAVTTGYLAEQLENTLGKECEGVNLCYFREEKPLGTAGGVLQTRDFIGEEDFVVISGDSVSEIDIQRAEAERQKRNAEAMIVLSHAENPGEYGVVLCDREGRITGFSEKPSLSGTYSDTVNTGTYLFSHKIFERIPEGIPYDFGKDLFPAMLSSGVPLYGIADSSYWCDIGDAESYYKANMRFSNGENAIGKNCVLEESEVTASVMMDGCRIAAGSQVLSSVLCERVTVGKEAVIGEGCVIGADSVIGEGAILMSGTRLPADSRIPDGMTMRSGIILNGVASASAILGGNGILCSVEELTAALAVKLGNALTAACRFGRIGIGHDGDTLSTRAAVGILRGIRTSGGEGVLLGRGFEAEAAFAAPQLGLDLSLFLRHREESMDIALYDAQGLYPKRDFERRFLSALASEDNISAERPRKSSECDFSEKYYFPMLIENRCELEGMAVNVVRENPPSLLLTRALLAKGASFREGGLRFSVSDDGFSLSAEQDGFIADDWHIKAILLRYLIRDRVSLPISSPATLLAICGTRCQTYTHCPSGENEDKIRADTALHPELIHACAAAMELAGLISASGKSLRELSAHIPSFAFDTVEYTTDAEHRLGILPELGTPDGDGVKAEYSRGNVRIIPSRRGYTLSSEAASGEYAKELLSLSRKEIERLLRKH